MFLPQIINCVQLIIFNIMLTDFIFVNFSHQFLYSIYICLISLKRGHQVFAWRLLQASPVSKKSRGLDVLVGTAGQPRDCSNSGWVDEAWGSKLVGQGGGCFDTTPSVKQQCSVEALTGSYLGLNVPQPAESGLC